MFICFFLHVSGNYVPIVKRNCRTYATPGICHSIWMTVWYAGRKEFRPAYQTVTYIEWQIPVVAQVR